MIRQLISLFRNIFDWFTTLAVFEKDIAEIIKLTKNNTELCDALKKLEADFKERVMSPSKFHLGAIKSFLHKHLQEQQQILQTSVQKHTEEVQMQEAHDLAAQIEAKEKEEVGKEK